MDTLKIPPMLSVAFFAAALVFSCTSEGQEMGPTIDEIEIIDASTSDDEPEIGYDECLEMADVTPLMETKARQYADATQTDDNQLYNCVYVYASTLDAYQDDPEKLAARIALLGFDGVYLSPGGNRLTTADTWLRTFISTCDGLGMEVYATYYEDPDVFVSEAAADDCIQKVLLYNRSVSYQERFSGISADLEPHTIKTDIGLGWIWNTDTGNGAGGPNDSLLEVTLDRLDYAAAKLSISGLKLHEAIWWHYQDMYDAGQVAHGDVNQFTEYCDWVSLMSYRNSTEGIWSISTSTLEACNKAKSVSICVKTATNDEVTTTIMPNGWNGLIETMETLKEKGLGYECFNGLDMFQYEALETMWEWTSDNEYKAE